jgi:hypothetical protein
LGEIEDFSGVERAVSKSLSFEESEVQEEFFARGWTDGLPIVPPTPERVQAMLDEIGAEDPGLLVGYLAARGRGVSLEHAAINAVMAGCRPEYFPVVVAALEAMFDSDFNLHAVLTSTGGAALCTVVSGPIAAEIGMNARHNVLGPGNRANATIGRALRLVAVNVLGSQPGVSDASSFGHPGKITLCFAEDPPAAPWLPLHAQLGYEPGDTTVTVAPTEGPRQLAQQLTRSAENILRTFASAIGNPAAFSTGKGTQGMMILGPEHAGFCIEQGWTQAAVREFLYRESRIAPEELLANGVQIEKGSAYEVTPDVDGLLPSAASPADIFLLTAGAEGAGWSAWIPNWAPVKSARAVTRRVRPAGEPLPDCGPQGCIVPWAPD